MPRHRDRPFHSGGRSRRLPALRRPAPHVTTLAEAAALTPVGMGAVWGRRPRLQRVSRPAPFFPITYGGLSTVAPKPLPGISLTEAVHHSPPPSEPKTS
jgi:hypothetical protein